MAHTQTWYLVVVFLCTFGCLSCGRMTSVRDIQPKSTDFYLVKRPGARAADAQKYFAPEYSQINNRRQQYHFEVPSASLRPPRLVGMALSGGGERSAAFQLGLLAGLSGGRTKGHTILNRIDYISSVSGRGWANGAYWASKMPDDVLFACLGEAAEKGKENVSSPCKTPAKMLRTSVLS